MTITQAEGTRELVIAARALAIPDDQIISVLQSSLYPGAKPDSIRLVLGYCKAAGLDPMQKPVHIVPMNVRKPGTRDDYEWRDVVMPGIGLYRTQAARTGELAGIDEPVFGPMREAFGIEFPDWCKVTVYRQIGGQRVPFTACEFWTENYATAGRSSDAPNSMWKRRPRGQLAKCAEAQALRKAFPELGSQPTADETIVDSVEVADEVRSQPPARPALPPLEDAALAADMPMFQRLIDSGKKTPAAIVATLASKFTLTEEQKARILSMKPTPKAAEPKVDDNAEFVAAMDAEGGGK